MVQRKKLIEVALPLDAINQESLRRKQKAPKGWPTSFHKWWAQRPLAAARAVLFAQMVDDPSSLPDLFPTEKKQDEERKRLFRIIKDLVLWENSKNPKALELAREEIRQSWRRICADNGDHPQAERLFNRDLLPTLHDPFAGSGSIPLSAQWLGLAAHATDLNPVAVLINKAMIEIPRKFAGRQPVNPEARTSVDLIDRQWSDAEGLADDVRYYGHWIRDEAQKRIGRLYPKVEVTPELVRERPDLKPYEGRTLNVVAWLWARTVRSPNPAFAEVEVPLVSTFMLSTKAGKEAHIEPILEGSDYRFSVKAGKPRDAARTKRGTKLSRGAKFECIMSGAPIASDHIYREAQAGRMGTRLMAIVAEADRGRVYIPPSQVHEAVARAAKPDWRPQVEMPENPRWFSPPLYGLRTYGDLFTDRQLESLTTFSDLVGDAMKQVRRDALAAGSPDDQTPLRDGGSGATAYAEAVGTYLGCVVDRMVYYGSSLTSWLPKDNALRDCMPRQALAMVWDFAEANPLGKSSGDVLTCTNAIGNYLEIASPNSECSASQSDARKGIDGSFVISTDPPYFDNIGYADLSDYFYVWLRRSLRTVYPDLFATVAVPKSDELVATPYRHGGKEAAQAFFIGGMTGALQSLSNEGLPGYPITIYYAFRQAETEDDGGTASTGWETFLESVLRSGLTITGTWPLRTEGAGRMIASGTNALASSIVLVCRKRATDAPTATRREFVAALKENLPAALRRLQEGNIAPVDLAQAAIGPGMAVYTRYAKVFEANGNPTPVREALALINQVLDETLAEQEGDFDSDTRWALAWFEQTGFKEGEYGVAEVLSKAKVTSLQGLVEAGIVESRRGKVRLLRPDELDAAWDPQRDTRLSAWETVHHLVGALEQGGEAVAGNLAARLGADAEAARDLAYRLYALCERKKRAAEALSYNALVQSWPQIMAVAKNLPETTGDQGELFGSQS